MHLTNGASCIGKPASGGWDSDACSASLADDLLLAGKDYHNTDVPVLHVVTPVPLFLYNTACCSISTASHYARETFSHPPITALNFVCFADQQLPHTWNNSSLVIIIIKLPN
jgi:hypothetical protein